MAARKIFRNRLRLREGPGAIDAEHLGGLAFGIHESLLTSTVNDTVTNSTIEVFPAWPKDWAVNFKLLARGGTIVTAAQQDGKVLAVKLEPTLAGTINLKNPWGRRAGQSVARQHHRNHQWRNPRSCNEAGRSDPDCPVTWTAWGYDTTPKSLSDLSVTAK